jgi:hypothetical protein
LAGGMTRSRIWQRLEPCYKERHPGASASDKRSRGEPKPKRGKVMTRVLLPVLIAAIVLVSAPGCKKSEESKTETPPAAAPAEKASPATPPPATPPAAEAP